MLFFAQAGSTVFADSPVGIIGVIALVFGGLVLIGLEIILPGAICGIIGGILLLSGIVFSFQIGGMLGGAIATIASLLGLALLFWFYVNAFPKTRFGKKTFLTNTISGAGTEAPGDDSLIGRTGTTLTILAPSGRVRVDGKLFEAVARDGFLASDENVVVLGRETFHLIVAKQ